MAIDSLFLSLISTRDLEYIILNGDLQILEVSRDADRFSEFPDEIEIGNDIRLAFPELCGIEEVIDSILQGVDKNFKLKSIAKLNPHSNLVCYIDLYLGCIADEIRSERRLMMLLEDTTEEAIVQQQLFQRVNESLLLKTAWSESQAYLDKIINSMADSLIVTDWQGIIKKINPAAQELFGYEEKELLERSVSMLSVQPEQLLVSPSRINSFQSDLFLDLEIKCKTKSGQCLIVAFSCSKLQTKLAEMPDLIYLGKDITKRVQAELKLRQALEKEQEIHEFKSSFVYQISQEIRTPLSTLLCASELLRHVDDEDRNEILRSIESNVKRLTQIVENVWIVSQAETVRFSLNPSWVNLTNFCEQLVSEIQLGLGNSQRLQLINGNPINAKVDLTIIRQILNNLIQNIIKYSSGNIKFLFQINQEQQEIWFEIIDSSCDIAPKSRDSFLIGTQTSNISGLELELAIVQKYAGIHGGRLEIKSAAEMGTIFRVVIPLPDDTIDDH